MKYSPLLGPQVYRISILLLILFIPAISRSQSADAHKSQSAFSLTPSIGLTLQSVTDGDEDVLSVQWLASLESKLFLDGEPYQFGALLYAKYGQSNAEHASPKKTQDDLILSLTPSYTILPGPGIRLFLELTGETQFRPGHIDSVETNFLDPLILYQMLFLGKRYSSKSEDGSETFDLTVGVGYALEQTVAQQFILQRNRSFVVSENSPLSKVQDNVTLESGYSAIADFNYENDLSNGLVFTTSLKVVGITKTEFTTDIRNVRVSSLFDLALSYKFLSLDYSSHLVYDRNISLRRNLEQSLVFGFKVKL